MNPIRSVLLVFVLGVLAAAAFVYFGVFDAAADVPHWPIVRDLMETVRERSIAVRARDVRVPPLDAPALISDGAQHYAAMCTGCHLAPGVTDSEIRTGLYPQPPNLTQPLDASPAQRFWVIKHGIKMSAMPAWGTTHDDRAIWAMVAFLQKLPGLTPQQYQSLVDSSRNGEHSHHHDDMSSAGNGGQGAADSVAPRHEHRGADATQPTAHDAAGQHAHVHEPSDALLTVTGDDGSTDDLHHHPHNPDAAAGGDTETPGPHSTAAPMPDAFKPRAAADAEAVAAAFHRALMTGDRASALAQLSADVTVTESGHTQSRSEYASGHLGEDIAYLKDVDIETLVLASLPMGDTAIVGSESAVRRKGESNARRSRELLILRRDSGAWKIVAIRWE
jgi:mono/diheme cytochrome c family protein